MIRLLVCGSRDWDDRELIRQTLTLLGLGENVSCMIHGAARGADTMAHREALALRFPARRIESMPADWGSHGRAAGRIRNQQMLDKLLSYSPGATLCVAFFLDTVFSPGTSNMILLSKKAGVPVVVVTPDTPIPDIVRQLQFTGLPEYRPRSEYPPPRSPLP